MAVAGPRLPLAWCAGMVQARHTSDRGAAKARSSAGRSRGRMTADGAIYQSKRLGAAYAFSRPPVHRHVAERIHEGGVRVRNQQHV